MFIRDPWSTETWQQAGPVNALSGVSDATDQVLLQRLHALALSLYQAQQDVRNAQARGDIGYAGKRLEDVQRLRDLFQQTAAQFQSNDADLLGAVDQFILAAGTWIEQSVGHLPDAVAAIPNAIVEGIGKMGAKLGTTALQVAVPFLVLGGLALWFLSYAEKSRTVRRLVA